MLRNAVTQQQIYKYDLNLLSRKVPENKGSNKSKEAILGSEAAEIGIEVYINFN